jgi:hypothetical protein
VDHGEGTSSRFKKKKNDKHRRDDNFVAVVERKTSCPKGNPTKPASSKDHFERLLDAPFPHHEVPVKHTLRQCRLMKNYVNGTLKPRTADQPKKGGPSPDNDDGPGLCSQGKTTQCTRSLGDLRQDPQGDARSSSDEKSSMPMSRSRPI